MSTRATWQKLQIFKIQDGGRPPFWKSLNRHKWKIVRFWWNLVHYIRYWTQLQTRDQNLKFLKFKMAAAAILKIDFLAITHRPIVRFQRNFVWKIKTACRRRLHHKKRQIFKNQDGGQPPFWKSLNRHISVKNRPILMKFSTLHQILNPVTDTWPKIEIFKIQDGCVHMK